MTGYAICHFGAKRSSVSLRWHWAVGENRRPFLAPRGNSARQDGHAGLGLLLEGIAEGTGLRLAAGPCLQTVELSIAGARYHDAAGEAPELRAEAALQPLPFAVGARLTAKSDQLHPVAVLI